MPGDCRTSTRMWSVGSGRRTGVWLTIVYRCKPAGTPQRDVRRANQPDRRARHRHSVLRSRHSGDVAAGAHARATDHRLPMGTGHPLGPIPCG